jgi:hypothetical protein
MDIKYLYTEGKRDVPVKVKLEGQIIGTINPVEGGWQYVPRGRKHGGKVFPTINEVQESLKV